MNPWALPWGKLTLITLVRGLTRAKEVHSLPRLMTSGQIAQREVMRRRKVAERGSYPRRRWTSWVAW
jgi:hypothetical protein